MPVRTFLFLLLNLLFIPAAWAASPPPGILVDHFEHAAMKNLLSGYIGCDSATPGVCRFSYSLSSQDTFGKAAHSLRIDYDVRAKGSYTYLWLHLGPEGKDRKLQNLDIAGHSYLSFWVKAGSRGENFKVELHSDTNGNGRYDPGEDGSGSAYVGRYIGKGGLREEWQKVVIPLVDFSGIKDLSRAMEIVFVFENLRGNRQGTIYVDDILFGSKKLSDTARNAPMPTPAMQVPGTDARDVVGDLMGGMTQVLTARIIPCEILEGVGFEVSWDEGKNWSLLGVDYDTTKEIATVPWKIPLLPPSSEALLRSFSLGIRGQMVRSINTVGLSVRAYPDEALLQDLARRAFLYFKDNQHTKTGLFPDSAGGNASTAVAGFGLAALAIGAHNGWMTDEEARQRAQKTLATYRTLQQDPQHANLSKDGMFYHFLNVSSATRAGTSEISIVDTALFLYGALLAGEYFGGEIEATVRQLVDNTQWNKFYDPDARAFRLGWTPEKGYFSAHWDYYTDEAILIHILAAGSRNWAVPQNSFYHFRREKGRFGDGRDFVYSWTGTLFTYQYLAAWLNLQGWSDKQGCNWWENSRDAMRASRDFCWYNGDRVSAYGPHRWGISCFYRPEGYTGHFGTPPNGAGQFQEDGTLSPIACASALTFLPFESLLDIKYQLASYPFLLGPYGLRNSYNLQRNWFSNVDFGLDCGLLLLSMDNLRDGFVWKTLQKNTSLRKGLAACGLRAGPSRESPEKWDLPSVPQGAPGMLRDAQKNIQKMENLCANGDLRAFKKFLEQSATVYAKAMTSLDTAREKIPPMTELHVQWLRALMAQREASVVAMRRYFGRMIQCLKECSEGDRMAVLRPYLDYITAADLRDFQDGAYAVFRELAQITPQGVTLLEDFASYAQSKRRFNLSVRVWNDALALRRGTNTPAQIADHAREIAEGYLKIGREENAVVFDRVFLAQIHAVRDPALAVILADLGKRYERMGAIPFSKECFAQAAKANSAISYRDDGTRLAARKSS